MTTLRWSLAIATILLVSRTGCTTKASDTENQAVSKPSPTAAEKEKSAAPAKEKSAAPKKEKPGAAAEKVELPKVDLPGWAEVFQKHPELYGKGVHTVELPEKAFVVVGEVPLASVRTKTSRNRETARALAELEAKRELLQYCFDRDKRGLRFPAEWQKFADDALQWSAYQRTVTVLGMQKLATWTDAKSMCCLCLVAQANVDVAKDFAERLGRAGLEHFLDDFRKTSEIQSLYRAFEFDAESQKAREGLAKEFLARGQRIAAYVIQQQKAKLPGADDPLARFLAGSDDPAWREGMDLFQAKTPDLERALPALLRGLDSRYADPDAFNYVGVCYRKLGYPRLASVFLARAVEQSPKHVHRYALTNLGLCLLEAGQVKEARSYLSQAVAEFPDEPWTENARKALAESDKPQ